jgi:hypothetical protein
MGRLRWTGGLFTLEGVRFEVVKGMMGGIGSKTSWGWIGNEVGAGSLDEVQVTIRGS